MRTALLALLAIHLSGCLIVRKHEEIVEEPCPEDAFDLMATVAGPFALLGNEVYFVADSGTVARMAYDGGVPSELTSQRMMISELVTDGESLYWAAEGVIWRMRLTGGAPFFIATGHDMVSAMLIDGDFVVWAGNGGLVQWNRLDESVRVIDQDDAIPSLAGGNGTYFYSNITDRVVRRSEPPLELVTDIYAGPLVLAGDNVYFYELDNLADFSGRINLVPRDGGPVVTTARELPFLIAMTNDDQWLFFITTYGAEYRVRRVSQFGGTVETLACGKYEEQLLDIEVTPQHVWWADGRGLYRLAR